MKNVAAVVVAVLKVVSALASVKMGCDYNNTIVTASSVR